MEKDLAQIFPELSRYETKTNSCARLCSYVSDLGEEYPVLVLIHGWRHVIATLRNKFSLFVPELPGYGFSAPSNGSTKRLVGQAIMEALMATFDMPYTGRRKVILCGFDRGARVCHRVAVDKGLYTFADIVAVVLLDILPSQAQWKNFSTALNCVRYFHWPFLANVELAVDMIEAYGGSEWCRKLIMGAKGSAPDSLERLQADNALESYAAQFSKHETLRNSCLDYAASAAQDLYEQMSDQEAERKIAIPTLIIFSAAQLGASANVTEIWREWVQDDVLYQGAGIGNGRGHFLPEEAWDEVSDLVLNFVAQAEI